METKHTKGKWLLEKSGKLLSVVTDDRSFICDTGSLFGTLEKPNLWDVEIIANAKLIVAAPEMLEALVKIVDTQYNPNKNLANLNSEIRKVKKLIKKATE